MLYYNIAMAHRLALSLYKYRGALATPSFPRDDERFIPYFGSVILGSLRSDLNSLNCPLVGGAYLLVIHNRFERDCVTEYAWVDRIDRILKQHINSMSNSTSLLVPDFVDLEIRAVRIRNQLIEDEEGAIILTSNIRGT